MKLKLRTLSLLVAVVALVLALLLVPAAALAQPAVPLQFEGTVTIGVSPAPVGTTISAEVAGDEVATNAPDGIGEEGYYRLDVSANEGDVVVLKVNGVVGGEAAYPDPMSAWHVVCNLAIEGEVVTYYTLTVSVSPSGGGSVSLSPSQPVGGYEAGTTVTLTASVASGYEFDSWSGDLTGSTNPDTIVMDSDKSVTANFELIPQFTGSLAEDARDTLVVIPTGVTELDISLEATADLDLELYDGDTFVIGWGGEIDSLGSTTGTYEGDTFAYSGWNGGEEYITADGPLSRAYTLKVYGFEAGDYTVTVSYMPAAPPNPPPTIAITAPDGTVGMSVTIEVSATDPDGVALVSFMVSSPWPEEWEWGSNSNSEYENIIEYVMSFDDEVSLTFVPGWAGTYTVDAWAVDDLGNRTPDATPVTATFIVSDIVSE